jgi:hypothetical protein
VGKQALLRALGRGCANSSALISCGSDRDGEGFQERDEQGRPNATTEG